VETFHVANEWKTAVYFERCCTNPLDYSTAKVRTGATECARDRDLYELVSCRKFVNEILFCIIYKTLYLTWEHHALGVILCLCLNFSLSYQQLNCLCKAKEA
jgi:hypothetical protein